MEIISSDPLVLIYDDTTYIGVIYLAYDPIQATRCWTDHALRIVTGYGHSPLLARLGIRPGRSCLDAKHFILRCLYKIHSGTEATHS